MADSQTFHKSKHGDVSLDDSPVKFDGGTLGYTVLHGFEADNSGNTSDVFVKIWDAATSPTVGTTVPNNGIFRIEAGKKQAFILGAQNGIPITDDFYFVCVTTGGTGGSTPPTNAVTADIFTD